MSHLILRDSQGHEIDRKEIAPQERYQLYEDCRDHALLSVNGKRYTLHTVAWLVPEEDCIAKVTFHSYESCDC